MKNHVLKKWNSFDKYEPDYGPMKYYTKKKGLCKSSNGSYNYFDILKQNMITEPCATAAYNVLIAQDFKKLYSDIVKFSNGNFYVCVDGKWKIDEHNVHITHVITDLYFDDLTRDLCYLKKFLNTFKEDPDQDKNMLNLITTAIKSKDAIKEKIQAGLSSKPKDVFASALYDEHYNK